MGVAIGDRILDIAGLQSEGLLAENSVRLATNAFASDSLNPLMAAGPVPARFAPASACSSAQRCARLRPEGRCTPSGRAGRRGHALARGDGRLYGFLRIDLSCHQRRQVVPAGQSSAAELQVHSDRVSRTGIVAGCNGNTMRRPSGQTRDAGAVRMRSDVRADQSARLRTRGRLFCERWKSVGRAHSNRRSGRTALGICLVVDWSARDIQAWEYQPLGPFLGKSFSTSLSPWVVTMEALAPFRMAAFTRAQGDPAPLPYLFDPDDREHGGLDLSLEASLCRFGCGRLASLRAILSRSNFRDLYWTMAQMLTHHASNGWDLRPGDLLASGTVSGADEDRAWMFA